LTVGSWDFPTGIYNFLTEEILSVLKIAILLRFYTENGVVPAQNFCIFGGKFSDEKKKFRQEKI